MGMRIENDETLTSFEANTEQKPEQVIEMVICPLVLFLFVYRRCIC